MKSLTGKQIAWWNIAGLVIGFLPVALFWFSFSRQPAVEVLEAKRLLADTNRPALLVDVRPEAVFESKHAPGAVNFPSARLAALSSARELPAEFQGRTLLVICNTGLSSARAVARLKALGVAEAYNVSGGMQAWLAEGDGKKPDLPFRAMTSVEQTLVVLVAFVLKPIYMLLALGLIIWLWRQPARDLQMLRWGLIWFWLGENGCSIDYLFYARGSDFWEYVHGYGMAVGFSMVLYAFIEGLDYRVIKFSPEKERCAALNLCRACFKYADAPCGLKRLFLVMIPAFALLALMPLCAALNLTSYATNIFGTTYIYWHLMSSQLFELRVCPLVAFVLFVASWLVLIFKRREPVAASKILFAAALGPLSFGMLRMFFVSSFLGKLMWFDVWEEITEFLFLLGTGMVLWVFREGLFAKKTVAAAQAAPVLAGS